MHLRAFYSLGLVAYHTRRVELGGDSIELFPSKGKLIPRGNPHWSNGKKNAAGGLQTPELLLLPTSCKHTGGNAAAQQGNRPTVTVMRLINVCSTKKKKNDCAHESNDLKSHEGGSSNCNRNIPDLSTDELAD
jgi:hypothetical protein